MSAEPGATVRILVVADDPLARAGIATLVAGEPGLEVAGRLSSAELTPEQIAVYRADVIAWDAGWQPVVAIDRLADIADGAPPVALLLDEADQAAAAWSAGARAVLRRSIPSGGLAAALVSVAHALYVSDARVTANNRGGTPGSDTNSGQAAALAEPLTPRELEVLRLMADGLPNKTIAARLGISEHTVKFHVNAVMGKLGAASRTEAVVQATRLGLILL